MTSVDASRAFDANDAGIVGAGAAGTARARPERLSTAEAATACRPGPPRRGSCVAPAFDARTLAASAASAPSPRDPR